LGALAVAWRESCRSLAAVKISHGDIHAGNTLVRESNGRQVELSLVDYDNVWFPGLHTPLQEIGHPAFQHPRRAEIPIGPHLDAVPNTLTYLSLTALATDPGLWTFHKSDDRLLFEKNDLTDPSAAVWTALLNSPDSALAALAATTVEWLHGPPSRFESLEHVLSKALPTQPGPPGTRVNVWPPRPAAPQLRVPPNAGWPPNAQRTAAQQPPAWAAPAHRIPPTAQIPRQQSWQGMRQAPPPPMQSPPASPPPPSSPVQQPAQKDSHGARLAFIIVAVILALIVIGLLSN